MKEELKDLYEGIFSLEKPKLTHDKCPVCRKIHGKKIKGTRNTLCSLKCLLDGGTF